MKRVDPISLRKVQDSGSTSDSGALVQVSGDFHYRPNTFNDPRNTSSDKENTHLIESQTVLMMNDLNITDGNRPEELPERPPNFVGPYCPTCIPKWPRCFCISESEWENAATQQVQMPRTSSPYPDDSDRILEQLELETDNDLDEIDYRARPANDRRPPKPILRCRLTLRRSPPNWDKNDCPTPQTSPKYITMVASLQQTRQHTNEVRGILSKRRKMPHGWPKCSRRTPPKIVLRNNDLYNTEKIENHHYKEPQEKGNRVFFNMQINVQSNMQRED